MHPRNRTLIYSPNYLNHCKNTAVPTNKIGKLYISRNKRNKHGRELSLKIFEFAVGWEQLHISKGWRKNNDYSVWVTPSTT